MSQMLGHHLSYPGWAAEYIWLYGMLESGNYTFPTKWPPQDPRIRTQDLSLYGCPPGTIWASSSDDTRRATTKTKVLSSNPEEATLWGIV